ncbi:MAG: hypothetical protein IK990_12300 [Ruminiclostridium sp.]|nr:hypothetical protein [Ruminiclostridium sp.]
MSIYNEQFDRLHTGVTAESVIAAASTKKYKRHINKAVTILVVIIAALSVCFVSVGAACNWDFKSLLVSDYSRNRREFAEVNDNWTGKEQEPFMYEGTVTYPEGVGMYHEMTDRELELLDMITIPVEKTFETEDYTLIVHGVLYDGYNLMIKLTVIDNSGYMDHTDSNTRSQFWYYCKDNDGNELFTGWLSGGDWEPDRYNDLISTNLTFPDDMKTATITVGKQYTDNTGFMSYPPIGEFTIEIPDISDLHRTYFLDKTANLGGYKESHLRNITVSPTGVFIEFDFNLYKDMTDINSVHLASPPVFFTMNDGTVIATTGGTGHYDVNEDGTFYCSWQLKQEFYMIDPFDIASVQVGDLTVELDDSMIIEE